MSASDSSGTHLLRRAREVFAPSELNELILNIYNFVRWSIRDGCQRIVVEHKRIVWMKDGVEFAEFPLIVDEYDLHLGILQAFDLVLARDKMLSELVKLTSEHDGIRTYSILIDPSIA